MHYQILKEYVKLCLEVSDKRQKQFDDSSQRFMSIPRPKWAKFIHLSKNDLGDEFTFEPRIPLEPFTDNNQDYIEDTITKRTSWSETVENALEALEFNSSRHPSLFIYATETLPGEVDTAEEFNNCEKRLKTQSNSNYGRDWERRKFISDKFGNGVDDELFVKYSPIPDAINKQIDNDLKKCVPDADETEELWATKPVTAYLVGMVDKKRIIWFDDLA